MMTVTISVLPRYCSQPRGSKILDSFLIGFLNHSRGFPTILRKGKGGLEVPDPDACFNNKLGL